MPNKMTKRKLAALETKKKLLEVGERLIAEKGFDAISVEDITNACGFAKGTFYSYFKRKEDIIYTIGWGLFTKLDEEIQKMVDAPFLEKLRFYYTQFMITLEYGGIQVCRQWICNYIDPAQVPPDMEQTKLSYDSATLKNILLSAIEQGELARNTPVEAIVNLLVCELYGMMTCWCMSDGSFDPKEWTEQFFNIHIITMLSPYLPND